LLVIGQKKSHGDGAYISEAGEIRFHMGREEKEIMGIKLKVMTKGK
jgi:hypothetical protein